jgi:hypothetical protein
VHADSNKVTGLISFAGFQTARIGPCTPHLQQGRSQKKSAGADLVPGSLPGLQGKAALRRGRQELRYPRQAS